MMFDHFISEIEAMEPRLTSKDIKHFGPLKVDLYDELIKIAPKATIPRATYWVYNYDLIVAKLLFSSWRKDIPKSADYVLFKNDQLIFIELKTGYRDKITKDNWNLMQVECSCKHRFDRAPQQLNCDIICPECSNVAYNYEKASLEKRELLFNLRNLKKGEMDESLMRKLLETYITLEKEILPRYAQNLSMADFKLYFFAVSDDVTAIHAGKNCLAKYTEKNHCKQTNRGSYYCKRAEEMSVASMLKFLELLYQQPDSH